MLLILNIQNFIAMKKLVFLSITAVFFLMHINAQDVSIPQLGVEAPSFSAQSTEGMIHFPADYGKMWKILISHPKDFTPVCSSELLDLAHQQKSFEDLNTQIVVVSTDILDMHKSWKEALEQLPYHGMDPVKIHFPMVSDNDFRVSFLYGMIHSTQSLSENIRGVYFIDPDNIIRSIQFYPNDVGRSVKEMKRTLLALQETNGNDNLVTPADWEPGDDVLVKVLSDKDKENLGMAGSDYYQPAWFLTYKKTE
jgi:peroxiredoxin (alkyl hydroperoxide reductase subunit C)